MVVTQGADYRIVEVNDAFCGLAGYGDDEVHGRSADDLQLWGDAGQRRLSRLIPTVERAGPDA